MGSQVTLLAGGGVGGEARRGRGSWGQEDVVTMMVDVGDKMV